MLCSLKLSLPVPFEVRISFCLYDSLREVLLQDIDGFHIMKGESKATPERGRMARHYLFILEVMAAGEEGSKDPKLCMNYDVMCSLLAHHRADLQS